MAWVFFSPTSSHAATICGFEDGDPRSSWVPYPGYECRFDTVHGLWGACSTTVVSVEECGFAGVCVDRYSCSGGCGRLSGYPGITTFLCAPLWFCSTAVLIHGSDESFDNIECGSEARTDTLFQFPKSTEATTTKSTISSTSTSIPSISLGSSTSPPTGTGLKPSPIPTSSFTPSTTPSSTSSPPNPEPLNIGAIVGGAISGLTVICLTILGIVLIRRKHGAKRQATSAPDHVPHGENAFSDDAALDTYNSRDAQKSYLWDASHGPVELQGGRDLHVEAVELPGQGEHMDMSKGST
ncbi:hypothetical protein LEMA_P015710.1 [Plenodomus lingam JN3]|uniref:Uncharacterized protein n=1 Tax=Leptosphaeria maculans (strain JN3 / isolate v23.1.3 / race Av1-4-5-6-7-8) TaxID=985895 RepID=E5A9V0_LEPMJ|nr:hypothetical protein LEMA_P015710.1 [Plenodomus lingam JN3]CBY00441.1 hypothetical protein LEMA_P015710.1 [Plenodomus lingam JN3]